VRSPAKRLIAKKVSDWPKLAWVAVTKLGSDEISVLHGPCVETNPEWCVEAVWAGDFSGGGLDRTEVIVGTGVRVRGDSIVFVSSGDALNRLHRYHDGDTLYVSNSLSALLAVADLDLIPDHDYIPAMESIADGLWRCVRGIPSSGGQIFLTYFHNLVLEDTHISEVPKPSSAPHFTDFATYRDYLFASARKIGENVHASERRHDIMLLAAVSSGYDAVLAREAGARETVTIKRALCAPRHIFDLNDSGAAVAHQLGMTCKIYSRSRKSYPFEDALWASMGNVMDANLSIFDFGDKLCLLFFGFMGDVLWDKKIQQLEPLHRKDTSGVEFSECRLELGVFNCSPVFWGCQNESELHALSNRQEMLPWTLGTDYDRPIPRRLAEEAGVARGSFGIRKRFSAFSRRYGRPLSKDLREDFAEFVERRGGRVLSGLLEVVSLVLRGVDSVILRKLPGVVRFSCRDWLALPDPSVFFVWANERRKCRYLVSLQQADAANVAPDSVHPAGRQRRRSLRSELVPRREAAPLRK
jgi:hypothetical protein